MVDRVFFLICFIFLGSFSYSKAEANGLVIFCQKALQGLRNTVSKVPPQDKTSTSPIESIAWWDPSLSVDESRVQILKDFITDLNEKKELRDIDGHKTAQIFATYRSELVFMRFFSRFYRRVQLSPGVVNNGEYDYSPLEKIKESQGRIESTLKEANTYLTAIIPLNNNGATAVEVAAFKKLIELLSGLLEKSKLIESAMWAIPKDLDARKSSREFDDWCVQNRLRDIFGF